METPLKKNWLRVLVLALAVVFSGAALAACGADHEEKTGIVEGEPVHLGPLEYNVLFTRPLNKADVEDSQYLVGQPDAKPGFTYIGVFVKIHNTDEDNAHTLPEHFNIIDTTGQEFENIPSDSIYALQPGTSVPPDGNVPEIDSTPQIGPIQASMLLYLMDDASTELRPIELHIEGEDGPATVELDL